MSSKAIAAGNLQFGPPSHLVSKTPFNLPFGIALDENAKPPRLIIADTANHALQWADASDPTNLSFQSVPLANGFVDPEGMAADANGNLYVVNTLGNELRKFSWNGMTYQDHGNFCGTSANNLKISLPRDVAVDGTGAVYMLDSGNRRVLKASGPNAQAWTELAPGDPSWSNPYGLTVGSDMKVYVADTGNHRIVRLDAQTGKTLDVLGQWGTQQGGLRYPRGVAVDKDGRIFVADTYNHRVHVMDAKGKTLTFLGQAPGIGALEKIVVDSTYRIFAVDSDNNCVVAFLGPKSKPLFDVFVRDDLNDKGAEPSMGTPKVASPDIVVRNKPDVDRSIASKAGLENTYLSQNPHYGEPNYVYVELHNNGSQPATSNVARLYWYDPTVYSWDPANFKGAFPGDWHFQGSPTSGSFYTSWLDSQHNQPGNVLFAGSVAPGENVVIGPLIWLPPDPSSAGSAGDFRLAVRVSNPFDSPPTKNPPNLIRLSNDVSEIPVHVRRGPFPIGNQNTLVVPINFSDAVLKPLDMNAFDPSGIEHSINAWLGAVSYGQTSVSIGTAPPYTPQHTSDKYDDPLDNPIISLMEEMLPVLLNNNPNALSSPNGQPIGRILLLTNNPNQGEWATNGPWHFTPAQIDLTASILSATAAPEVFHHSICHHFGLYDLYGHDPPYHFNVEPVGLWDTMAKFNDAHPLVWNKERAEWISARQAHIAYAQRPKAGDHPAIGPFDLFSQETAAAQQNVAIAIGLTPETPLAIETRFLYVEARTSKLNSDPDSKLLKPWLSDGVLMYYVDTSIPQGQGVVIVEDADPTKPDLVNATYVPGVRPTLTLPAAGLKVTVKASQNGADYQIAVDYAPPAKLYDVYMSPGSVPWESPDIFVDIPDGPAGKHPGKYQADIDPNPDNAVDEGEQAAMTDVNMIPLINHVYARVHDKGGVDADQIVAHFFFAEPSNLGGVQAFNHYGFVPINGKVLDGKFRQAEFDWTPKLTGDSCARVELGGLGIAFDADLSNNAVTHNFSVQQSTSKSPFTAVDFPFVLSNDEAVPRLVYFRADGIPKGWTWSFQPDRVSLAPHQIAHGTLHLQPKDEAPICTSQVMKITSWVPTGDTMIRIGGATLQVDLRKRTDIKMNVKVGYCRPSPGEPNHVPGDVMPEGGDPTNATTSGPQAEATCARLETDGCTDPKEANQLITVEYSGPDGNPIFHQVMTDANGCFKDFLVVHEGDKWQVGVVYPGNACDSKSQVTRPVKVPLPTKDHPELDVPTPFDHSCAYSISKDLHGFVRSGKESEVSGCGRATVAVDQTVQLRVTANANAEASSMAELDGEIEIPDLRMVALASHPSSGVQNARFRWKTPTMEAVGWITGLSGTGSHRKPGAPHCKEPHLLPEHWELSLDGTVIDGNEVGARVHAVLAIDVVPEPNGTRALGGALEGVFERDCNLEASRRAGDERVRRARADDARAHPERCGGDLPCMTEISKEGRGRISLTQVLNDRCAKPECKSDRTFSSLQVELHENQPNPSVADGLLRIDKFAQIFESDPAGRGEHVGQFIYLARDGTRIEGRMVGVSGAGTHRMHARECEKAKQAGHIEGRLVGTITEGPDSGAAVEARYAAQVAGGEGYVRDIWMTLEGWKLAGCLDGVGASADRQTQAAHR